MAIKKKLEEPKDVRTQEEKSLNIPTEEVQKFREDRYRADISSREKQQAILQEQGANPQAAARAVRQQVRQQQPGEVSLAEQIRQRAAEQFIQESGVLEEKQPKKTELDIEKKGIVENLPILGSTAKAGGEALSGLVGKPLAERFLKGFFPGADLSDTTPTLIQNPETMREMALQEIQRKVIKQGTTTSEKVGALIEAIPIVGGLVSKYARGLIETPSGNVDAIVSIIGEMKTSATSMAKQARTGIIDPYDAIERITEYENEIAALEQKIRLLALESAELTANSEQLNKIEMQILETRRIMYNAKQSAAMGVIAPASDSNIFLKLNELEEEEDAV